MDVKPGPLKVIVLFLLAVAFSQYVIGKSVRETLTIPLADSTLNQLDSWENEDSLLQWMGLLKSESQRFRNQNEVAEAIAVLSACIDNLWRQPQDEEESKLLAWVFVNRAYLYDQKYGDYLSAKSDYLKALEHFESIGYSDFYVARYLLQPLANIYTRLAENEQAIGMLEEFQRICRNENQIDALMNSYNDLGRAYMNKGAYDEAVELFYQGSLIDRENLSNLGLIESSKAEAQLYMNAFDKGIESAQLSIQHLTKANQTLPPNGYLFEANSRYLSGAHTTLGKLYLEKGQFEKSQFQFEKALEITQQFYAGKHRRKAKILIGLGDCYQEANQLEESITLYQKALVESINGFDEMELDVNPTNQFLFADVVIGEALIAKARGARKLLERTNKLEWLQLSVDTYLVYFSWIKKLRAEQLNLQSKLNLTKEIHGIGEETLEAIFILKEHTNDDQLVKTAFQIIEQTKGIILSESNITDLYLTSDSELKAQILELDRLRMQKSLFQIHCASVKVEGNSVEEQRLKQNIEELDRQIQILDFQLKQEFPSYANVQFDQNDSVDFDKLSVYLDRANCDLRTYFLGQDNLFVVSSNEGEFTFSALNMTGYNSLLPQFLEQLSSHGKSNAASYEKRAIELYELLFPHDLKCRENLLVLPDGDLNLLPFEALVKGPSDQTASYKKMNYLLLNHAIYYAPSVKFILKEREAIVPEKSYLGFAPIFNESTDYAHLPHSEEEVVLANNLFSGDVFLNNEASKSAFIANAGNYELIHLSTHAGIGNRKKQ